MEPLRLTDDSAKGRQLTPDLSAAAHADVLFAKEMANGDSDLMQYCKREKIPFVPFRDL